MSSFKAKPDVSKGERLLDKSLNQRVKSWRQAFMGQLLKGYRQYLEETINDPPKEIMEATRKYEADNDRYAQFLMEKCIKCQGQSISTITLAEKFMEWSQKMFGEQSVVYSHPKKYTGFLETALGKDPWYAEKDKNSAGNMVFKNISIKHLS